ncbi:hypothetical protein MCUN1_000321 [Malassezia cuniculi]|uniref:Ribophorin II C-terminal domain-containing protein n=1 Tax=Malassezia cuniculi TaxID=948313 RepID=A0AAF0J4U4_9BASI|nr:hypothetical protein MCUN1_000321 [Malassezia cuniculi]
MWTILRTVAVVACAALCVAARAYDVKNAQFNIATFDGSSRLTVRADKAAEYSAPTEVAEADDVYRFSATVTTGGELTSETIPHQAWIVVDDGTSAAAVWPLRVRSSGALSWSMRVDRMPAQLQNAVAEHGANWPFRIALLIGSFGTSASSQPEPLELPIAKLTFSKAVISRVSASPSKRAENEREEGFEPWPHHVHTFAKAPWLHMPPAVVSAAVAAAVVFFPWLGLVHMWRQIKSSHKTAKGTGAFIATVVVLEALAGAYWIGLSPFYVFPAVGVVLLALLRTAREALS